MTNKDITNIENTMFAVRTTLANDKTIRKLLYYDTPDALDKQEAPSIDQILGRVENGIEYITLFPVMEKGVVEYGRNTYIMITLPMIDLDLSDSSEIFVGFQITAISDMKHYMLNHNKLRLMEICNRVIELIDNQKFPTAGKTEVLQMEQVIFTNQVYGYNLKVMCADQGQGSNF